MKPLTSEQVGFIVEDASDEILRLDKSYTKMLRKKKYTSMSSKLSYVAKDSILLSMISYRVENDATQSQQHLLAGQVVVEKIQSLQALLESLMLNEGLDIKHEPNCILPEFLEHPIYLSLLNKNINDLVVLQEVCESDVTEKDKGFAFAGKLSPLLLMGVLDQKNNFMEAYKSFREIKSIQKNRYERWNAFYVDMLAAIVERDQSRFDSLHLQAEAAMQNHARDKKWDDDLMSGGHEYNVLIYDYQGTAMCCLALLRGMRVNHFSCFYPEELITEHVLQ